LLSRLDGIWTQRIRTWTNGPATDKPADHGTYGHSAIPDEAPGAAARCCIPRVRKWQEPAHQLGEPMSTNLNGFGARGKCFPCRAEHGIPRSTQAPFGFAVDSDPRGWAEDRWAEEPAITDERVHFFHGRLVVAVGRRLPPAELSASLSDRVVAEVDERE
jgi:hypothetical protein